MILVVVSTGHFDPLISECNRLSGKFDFFGQVGSSTVTPNFPHVKTAPPSDIERWMNEAEVVISHGGAGMTAMLYRLKKRTVVIPKQKRYGEPNDLQVELAQKWGELGTSILCMDVEKLEEAIQAARVYTPKFPPVPSLGNHLRHVLNLDGPVPEGNFRLAGY